MERANDIHPTAVVDPDVKVGTGNVVGAYAVVQGPCELGDDNWIGPHAAIGTPAQHRAFDHGPGLGAGVRIGDRCVLREFSTVHQGTHEQTTVGDDCYLMAYAHVPHDASIGDGVTIANAVQVGGHTWIDRGANLGLGAVVHQGCAIGAWAMVGMQAAVTRDVPPGLLVAGVPARPRGVNRVGLRRAGIDEAAIEALDAFMTGGADGVPEGLEGPLAEAFARFADRARRRP